STTDEVIITTDGMISTTDEVISTTTSMTTSMVSGNTIAFQRSITIIINACYTRAAALLLHAAGETKYSVRQTRTGQLSAESEPLLISGTTRKLRSNKKHQQETTNSIVIVVEQSIPEQQLHEQQTTSLMPVGYDRYHDSKHSISDTGLSIAGLFAPLSLALTKTYEVQTSEFVDFKPKITG
ncbi:unnamed protein product, partial [Rotaria magnacalcarata]